MSIPVIKIHETNIDYLLLFSTPSPTCTCTCYRRWFHDWYRTSWATNISEWVGKSGVGGVISSPSAEVSLVLWLAQSGAKTPVKNPHTLHSSNSLLHNAKNNHPIVISHAFNKSPGCSEINSAQAMSCFIHPCQKRLSLFRKTGQVFHSLPRKS